MAAHLRRNAHPGDTGRGTRVSISADQERQAGEALRRTLGITILSAPA
jgi:hypothetical protein